MDFLIRIENQLEKLFSSKLHEVLISIPCNNLLCQAMRLADSERFFFTATKQPITPNRYYNLLFICNLLLLITILTQLI